MDKWENVKRLTKLQFIQMRSVFYVFLGYIILFTVLYALGIAEIHYHVSANQAWDIYTGYRVLEGVLIVCLILFFFGSYNLLSKDEISMFPGTVLTRYYSTLLLYHIMILALVVEFILMYLILGGLLMIASSLWKEMIPHALFNWEYLWKGTLLILARCLAVYGFSVLWYSLLERFRARIVYAVVAWIAILAVVFHRTAFVKTLVRILLGYAGAELSYGTYLLVLLITWLACLIFSWLLVRGVRSWKRADKGRLVAAFLLMWAGLFGGLMGYIVDTRTEDSYSYTYNVRKFQEFSEQTVSSLVDVSALPVAERETLGDLNLHWETPLVTNAYDSFDSILCSVSEAREGGLTFDASGIDENHVLVLLGIRDLKYAGEDLGEELLKACQDAVTLEKYDYEVMEGDEVSEDGEPEEEEDVSDDEIPEYLYYYQVALPETPVIVWNEALGNLRKYMSATTIDHVSPWELEDGGIAGRLCRLVICPDSWGLIEEEKQRFEEERE